MIVVADTSPLNYLILIEHIDILKGLYGHVVIPPAVEIELLSPDAPAAVRAWMTYPPTWLEVRTPGRLDPEIDPTLDEGELEAITLAQNCGPDVLLLVDDLRGRREAARLGLQIIGTLGLIKEAHNQHLLNLQTALTRLSETNFKVSAATWKQFRDTP